MSPTVAVEAATYPVVADTYANGVKPDVNFGSAGLVVVRKYGPTIGFAKFDFSGISTVVKQAELQLRIDTVKVAGVIDLYLVTEPWQENTLTFGNMPVFGSVSLASIPVTTADAGNIVSVDISEIVGNWVTGATPNYGIALYSTSVNVRLDSREKSEGTPMQVEVVLNQASCPAGTLLEPYLTVCAPINDISDQFTEPFVAETTAANLLVTDRFSEPEIPNLDELRGRDVIQPPPGENALDQFTSQITATSREPPIPGGIGIGTLYKEGTHQSLDYAILHTRMFVQPDGLDPSLPLEWLFTTATNHTDSGTEFAGIYASHLVEGGWFGIFGRPCSEDYPCPDGDTSNGWQAGWSRPLSEFSCNIADFTDQGDHLQKIMHYANESRRLDEDDPPLWQTTIFLWNYCTDEWDLIWHHEYRENKRDCSVENCYNWGPILETFGDQSEINELGYEDTLLIHDAVWSLLAPEETDFVLPTSPWNLFHLDANRGYGTGNRFVSAPAAAVGGSVTGVNPKAIYCANRETRQHLAAPLTDNGTWNCEEAGLVFESGDTLEQRVIGQANGNTSVGGEVTGVRTTRAMCKNNSTGQKVFLQLDGQEQWNCEQAGLQVRAGDKVIQAVRGIAE